MRFFGRVVAPKVPDLAIEVTWTWGGLDKLEIWCWDAGRMEVYRLRGELYVRSAASVSLKGIALEQLASFLDRPTTSQAIRDYRAALART